MPMEMPCSRKRKDQAGGSSGPPQRHPDGSLLPGLAALTLQDHHRTLPHSLLTRLFPASSCLPGTPPDPASDSPTAATLADLPLLFSQHFQKLAASGGGSRAKRARVDVAWSLRVLVQAAAEEGGRLGERCPTSPTASTASFHGSALLRLRHPTPTQRRRRTPPGQDGGSIRIRPDQDEPGLRSFGDPLEEAALQGGAPSGPRREMPLFGTRLDLGGDHQTAHQQGHLRPPGPQGGWENPALHRSGPRDAQAGPGQGSSDSSSDKKAGDGQPP